MQGPAEWGRGKAQLHPVLSLLAMHGKSFLYSAVTREPPPLGFLWFWRQSRECPYPQGIGQHT